MFRDLFLDPERFYREGIGEMGISREVVLIAIIGVMGTLGTYYAVSVITAPFNPITNPLPSDIQSGLYGHAVWPLASAFIYWLLLTFAIYVISWAYSSAGGFYLLAKYLAWAMIPMLFAYLLRTVALVYTSIQVDVEVEDQELAGGTDAAIAYLWEQIFHEPTVLIAYAIGSVFAIWTGYIAMAAVARVRDLERHEALRVVVLPIGAYVVYLLYLVSQAL